MKHFNFEEKLAAVKREIGWRRHVYPKRIALQKMSPMKAADEIAIMESIAADYEKAITTQQPGLF